MDKLPVFSTALHKWGVFVLMLLLLSCISLADPGDVLWYQAYDFNPSDIEVAYEGWCAKQTSDGGFVFAGTYGHDGEYSRMLLVKADDIGDTVWTRCYGWDNYNYRGRAILEEPDGGYTIIGDKIWNENTPPPSGTPVGVYIVRVDASGDTLWTNLYDDSITNYTYWTQEACKTDEGGYIIFGFTSDYAPWPNSDGFIIKADADGNEEWTRHYLAPLSDEGDYEVLFLSGELADDGGYILGGKNQWIYLDEHLIIENYALIMKVDANGDSLWAETYGDGDEFKDICATSDGGYIATGLNLDLFPNTHDNLGITKIDASLNESWSVNLFYGDGPYYDTSTVGWAICEDSNNGVYVAAGNKYYFIPRYYLYFQLSLVQVDQSGNSHVRIYDSEFDNKPVVPLDIQVTNEGNYLVSGYVTQITDPGTGDVLYGNEGFMALIQGGIMVSVDDDPVSALPENLVLSQNYPNPFNATTSIRFNITSADYVNLSIYDIGGRLIRTLQDGDLAAGSYNVSWDGTDEAGDVVASGIYFYRLKNSESSFTKQMVLLK